MKPAKPGWEEKIWTRRGQGTIAGDALRSPLLLLSGIYGAAMKARAHAYKNGLFKSHRVPARVIVVGNLFVGGTGKTPLAAWIAAGLAKLGLKTAVITRGYKGRAGKKPLVASEGRGPLAGPEIAGDEAVWLSQKLSGVPVIACASRSAAALLAVSRFGSTHLVLDDGFQHLALQRDLDILVMRADRDPRSEYLLPRGPLRESASATARAGAVVISGAADPGGGFPWIEAEHPGLPVFSMRYRPCGLFSIGPGEALPPDAPSLAFCGIGSPDSFFDSLTEAGVTVVERRRFDDHHVYTYDQVREMAARAREMGAARLVTTEKDAVKVRPEWSRDFPLEVLRVEPDLMGAEDVLMKLVLGVNE